MLLEAEIDRRLCSEIQTTNAVQTLKGIGCSMMRQACGCRLCTQACVKLSTAAQHFVPYWNVPLLRAIVPRQRRCTEALKIINATLDGLIQRCKDLVEEEEQEFVEEFVGKQDPSILHFLLASGDQVILRHSWATPC